MQAPTVMSDTEPQHGEMEDLRSESADTPHPSSGLHKGQQVAIEKTAKGNPNLPRKLRPRVEGQTLDPVPTGKHIDAGPAGSRAVEAGGEATPLEVARMDKSERLDMMREMDQAHNPDKGAHGRSGPMPDDYRRTTPPGQRVTPKTMQSKTNQLMDSRHRTEGQDESGGSHSAQHWTGSHQPMNR